MDVRRPNILFITSDQHRGDCYGFAGRRVKTPHLDRLAAQGTRFDACITPNVLCQPSRASILTGLLPLSHGVTDNGVDLPAPCGEAGFAGELARAGYDTGFIGKAHFSSYNTFAPTGTPECRSSSGGYADGWRGPYMGFEHVELMVLGHELAEQAAAGKGQHYERWLRRAGGSASADALALYATRLAPDVGALQTWNSALPPAWHHTEWATARGIDFLNTRRERPFALWLSYADPHVPFDCPAPWCYLHHPEEVDLPAVMGRDLDARPWWHRAYVEDRSVDPDMDAALRDHQAALTRRPRRNGRARDYGDSELQLRHTIANYYGMIAFIDHGVGRVLQALADAGLDDDTLVVFSSDHGDWLGDHGMLLKGPMMYEGLLRVGLVARGPGVRAGQVIADPVSTVDLAATFLDAAGAGTAAARHSRSLLPMLGGAPPGRDHAYNEWDLNAEAWGLGLRLRTVRTRGHKLTLELGSGAGELYDLGEDPHETRNLFDDAGARRVRRELEDMIAERPGDCLEQALAPSGVH